MEEDTGTQVGYTNASEVPHSWFSYYTSIINWCLLYYPEAFNVGSFI